MSPVPGPDQLFSLRLSGSVGTNIPKMLQMFKTGHEYMVEGECFVRTKIATVRHDIRFFF